MTFSYFMSGSGLGNLTVLVMTEMGQPDQLCQIRGDEQDQKFKRWNTMSVGVVGSTTLDSWVIVITATVGEPGLGEKDFTFPSTIYRSSAAHQGEEVSSTDYCNTPLYTRRAVKWVFMDCLR